MRHRRLHRAGDHRLPAGGPRAEGRASSPTTSRRSAKVAAHTGRCAAVVGFVAADRDIYNAAAMCANGEVAGHLPQAPAAQLRRVRRGPLLHARRRQRPVRAVRDRRREGRHQHLRRRVEPDRSAGRAGRRRRRAEHQHQRLAVPLRQGVRPRADAGDARRRCQLRARLRQPGVRPGRVGLRRRLDGVRRRRQPRRPRRAVRRGADDHRRAHRAGVPQAAARPAWPAHRGRDAAGARLRRLARARCHAARGHESRPCSRPTAELYEALVLGTGDYVRKNGFTDVVIGLSGGIDSTIVACIAVDALGADHVHGVSMPSRYSSDGSKTDAADLAAALGHRLPHDRDRAGVQRVPRHDRRVVRRQARRPHRGEPAEPGPWRNADGAVEQVRLDGADHRQQERDGRRLLHALRRLGRRVRRSSRTC